MRIVSSFEKKKIVKILKDEFGIDKFPLLILQFGKEKIRLFSGNYPRDSLMQLDKNLRVETAGLYFARKLENGFRLTLDGVHLIKNEISKNIVELNEQQSEEWMKGNFIPLLSEPGFKILKYKNDLLGCGKSNGEKIHNSVPKERRLKI